MAKLDDLIKQVPEPALREELARALKKLRTNKRFGLVFEEHLPETTLLLNYPIKDGTTVYLRDDYLRKHPYRVTKIKGTAVHLEPEKKTDEAITAQIEDLLAYKSFGEPIYPALTPNGSTKRGQSKPSHTVINGENLHAAQLLSYTHSGKVDVIYLDPPYNTGAKDWKYNNQYVDQRDTWRHSKWLSFMEKRLKVAKKLLKPDGVIVVTIDEHEVHHLGVLLETLYPEANRQMVTIVINTKGVTQERFSRVEEHAIFCFFGKATISSIGDDMLTPEGEDVDEEGKPGWRKLLRSGEAPRREDRETMFYPLLIDEARGAVLGAGMPLPLEEKPDFDSKIDGLTPVWPVRKDGTLGRWGVGRATLLRLIELGYVAVGRKDPGRNTWGISYITRKLQQQIEGGTLLIVNHNTERNLVELAYLDKRDRRIKTVWYRTSHNAGVGGTSILTTILGEDRPFSYPKSVYAVRDTLGALVVDKPNAVILDFFAGSGTTLHATAMLNAVDNGNRTCILVTNNEVEEIVARRLNKNGYFRGDKEFEAEGIFEKVTKPRVEASILGTRKDGTVIPGTYLDGREIKDGFEENVNYFVLDYLDPDDVALGRQLDAILPTLWLGAGGIGDWEEVDLKAGYSIPESSNYAILVREAKFPSFLKMISSNGALTTVYLVTDSERSFAEMRSALPKYLTVSMLYRDYLKNFAINTRRFR
jgi:adenine-specific DNA-methyltransferase